MNPLWIDTWAPEEQARLERLQALVAAELEASRLGTVVRTPARAPDPRAHLRVPRR